jgi:hypothetical protein
VKAADITDETFIEAVAAALAIRPSVLGASLWDVSAVLDGRLDYVRATAAARTRDECPDMPEPVVPLKVVLAKARKLIRRGLLTGCACGCRGEFEVVDLAAEAEAAERRAIVEAAIREHVEGRRSYGTTGEATT